MTQKVTPALLWSNDHAACAIADFSRTTGRNGIPANSPPIAASPATRSEGCACRWEFADDDTEFAVAVTTDDMARKIKLSVAGAGITFGMEHSFRAHIELGTVPILDAYCPLSRASFCITQAAAT